MARNHISARDRISAAVANSARRIVSAAMRLITDRPEQTPHTWQIESLETRLLFNATLYTYASPFFTVTPVSDSAVEVAGSNSNAIGTNAALVSPAAVRYVDGQPQIQTADISSDGFGKTWAAARSWSPTMTGTGILGNHWVLDQIPQLVQVSSSTIVVLSSGTDQRWFDLVSGAWTERFGGVDSLRATTEVDGSNTYNVFILTDSAGGQTHFFDFSAANSARAGQFRGYYDSYGDVTKVTSLDTMGNIQEVQRSNGTSAIESWYYTYTLNPADSTKELLTNIALRRSTDGTTFTIIRQVSYNYFGTADAGGNQNDLKSVQIKDGSGALIDTNYYRYWKSGQSVVENGTSVPQPAGALKYVLGPQAYAMAAAALASGSLDTAADSALSPFADEAFTYNAIGQVYQGTAAGLGANSTGVTGGLGTFTYTYSTNPHGTSGYNIWHTKVAELLPDGNTTTVYSDYAGEPMLSMLTSSNLSWGDFWKYDANGRVIWHANPSALNLPTSSATLDQFDDLLNFSAGKYTMMNDNTGLIDVMDYYSVGWQFVGTGGITANGNSLMGGLIAPGGTQDTFLTGTSTVTQTITANVAASGLSFIFQAARTGSSSQTLQVLLDGTALVVGSSTTVTPGACFAYYCTASFSVSAGTHTLQFKGLGSAGQTALVDVTGISGTNAPAVTDSGFESPSLATGMAVYDSPGSTAVASTAGGVTGYFHDALVQQGQLGTPILQETKTYFTHSNGSAATPAVVAPVAADTLYRNTNGTGGQTTSTTYGWYANSNMPSTVTTSAPIITTAENGPNTADITVVANDKFGRPQWTKDADGYVNYTSFINKDDGTGVDTGTGSPTKEIVDVNYNTLTTYEQGLFPAGWTHTTTGQNLVSKMTVDGLGRVIKLTSPNAVSGVDGTAVTYTVYNDTAHETRVYPGFTSSLTTTGPIEITREYRPAANSTKLDYTETLTTSDAPHTTGSVPDGTEPITSANIQSLSRAFMNNAGETLWTDSYFAGFAGGGLTYSQLVSLAGNVPGDIGTSGTNFYRTTYGFDVLGRQNHVQAPTGTITDTTFDALGRETAVAVGTSDVSPSNMTTVTSNQYDWGLVGDSLVTQVTSHPNDGSPDRVSQTFYDGRDRAVATKDGVQGTEDTATHRPIIFNVLDNLDEVTETDQYDGDGVTISSTNPQPPSASLLRARSTSAYDEQQRDYRDQTYSVNQSTGAVSTSALTTNTFYNHRGEVIEISPPGGQVTQNQYDGAGRDIKDTVSEGGVLNSPGTAGTWAGGITTANEVVLTQTLTNYDPDSNPIETITKDRFHDDAITATGDLGTISTGVLARVSYAENYYDGADRLTDAVDVGTNGGFAYGRSGNAPGSSDTAHVTHTSYDVAGNPYKVSDPRNLLTQNSYDMLGRDTQTIEASNGGSPATGTNVTTYAYDGDDHVTKQIAAQETPTQETDYIYGIAGGTSNLFSNDLLKTVEYPDPSSGLPSTNAANQESYSYNALGETSTYTDHYAGASGSVHSYKYDVMGRETADIATSLGTGIDASVRYLGFSFDTGGRPYQQTSYSDILGPTSGGYPANVVNQVEDDYNGLGQLTTQWQSHNGPVQKTGSLQTPQIQYFYSEMSGGVNNSRLNSMWLLQTSITSYLYGMPLQVTPVSATDNGNGYSTITVSTPNPLPASLVAGSSVSISGLTPFACNGTFSVSSVTSTTFSYLASGSINSVTGSNSIAVAQLSQSLDNSIGRVTAVQGNVDGALDAPPFEAYGYLGLDTIVEQTRGSGTKLSYVQQAGDTHAPSTTSPGGDKYTGLDAFGRTIDQPWIGSTGISSPIDRTQYGYDRNSNVLFKKNIVTPGNSELYHVNGSSNGYDSLNRIQSFSRGTLNGTNDTITTPTRTQTWNLDAVGNTVGSTAVVTNGTAQSRAVNSRNELTTVGSNTLTFDNDGNTTQDDSGHRYVYDAWRQIVQVTDGSNNQLDKYAYDATGRRVSEAGNNSAPDDLYYDGQNVVVSRAKVNVWGIAGSNELIATTQINSGQSDPQFSSNGAGATPGRSVTSATGASIVAQSVEVSASTTSQFGTDITYVAGYQTNGVNGSDDWAVYQYDITGALIAHQTVDFG